MAKEINKEKTGKNLRYLRENNFNLRFSICSKTRKNGICDKKNKCSECDNFKMDKAITQEELAKYFLVSVAVVRNWESGLTLPSVQDFVVYSELTGLTINEILQYD